MKTKILFLLLAINMAVIGAFAQNNESLKLTWTGGSRSFGIITTEGEQYTVDWGDGSAVETQTGNGTTGGFQGVFHTYSDTNLYTVTITGVTEDCKLTHFRCKNQQVSSIDLSDIPNLRQLTCDSNQLSKLDLSKNPNLQYLYCSNNQLTHLDVSKNTNLIDFTCSYNQLSALDVSKNTELTWLVCFSNQLNALDVSKNTELTWLSCGANQLSVLDVSKNTKLQYLYCPYNQLSALDVSKNTNLKDLSCHWNKLSSLDVRNNPNLEYLACSSNQLPLTDLYAISEKIVNPENKWLGTQYLVTQTVNVGDMVDFSTQAMINGIPTVFTVTENGAPASVADYSINNGKIVFNAAGNYTVTMTNSAIVSHTNAPAQVIADFKAVNNLTYHSDYLNINNISALINSDGLLFMDKQKESAGFTVPKNSGTASIFAGSLWFGGINAATDTLHLAAERFQQVGNDFRQGAINFDISEKSLWKMGHGTN